MDLVIMAAGMGSRFGGLKQLEPIDENGNFIIDYSIFDAIRSGFDRVVFIIKEENFNLFRETVGKRIEDKIETCYVFQSNNIVPDEFKIPEERKKPLGTGHALLCAKGTIHSNFAIINADDFYGYDAFKQMGEILKTEVDDNTWSMVCYKAKNTCSKNGEVKRGICLMENGFLTNVKDYAIIQENRKFYSISLDEDRTKTEISADQNVSMNLFGISPKIFDYLDIQFIDFLNKNRDNLLTAEFGIPTSITNLIGSNKARVKISTTNSVWKGLTFKDDRDEVVSYIANLKKTGTYPENLWNKLD